MPEMDQTGLTPDVFRNLNREYRLKTETQSTASSEVQAVVKKMTEAGVNPWGAKTARALNKMEPETGSANIRALLTYLLWTGSPLMTQRDLLDGNRCLADIVRDFLNVPGLTDEQQQSLLDDEAEEVGYQGATKGEALDNIKSRYIAGSSQMARAIEGFKRGEAVIASLGGVQPVKAGRGRRGVKEDAETPKPTKAEQQKATQEAVKAREAKEAETAPEPVAAKPSTPEAPKVIDLLAAQTMTKGELIQHYNHFAVQIGEKEIKSLESREVGVERLKGLHSRWHAYIRAQDEAEFDKAGSEA